MGFTRIWSVERLRSLRRRRGSGFEDRFRCRVREDCGRLVLDGSHRWKLAAIEGYILQG